MFAAVGTDGKALVVWGIGTTYDEAVADAEQWADSKVVALTDPSPKWDGLSTGEVYVFEIGDEQAQAVEAGQTDPIVLGIIKPISPRRGSGAPSEDYYASKGKRRINLRADAALLAEAESVADDADESLTEFIEAAIRAELGRRK